MKFVHPEDIKYLIKNLKACGLEYFYIRNDKSTDDFLRKKHKCEDCK